MLSILRIIPSTFSVFYNLSGFLVDFRTVFKKKKVKRKPSNCWKRCFWVKYCDIFVERAVFNLLLWKIISLFANGMILIYVCRIMQLNLETSYCWIYHYSQLVSYWSFTILKQTYYILELFSDTSTLFLETFELLTEWKENCSAFRMIQDDDQQVSQKVYPIQVCLAIWSPAFGFMVLFFQRSFL